ncbi:MAG: MarC family protein [Nanoarchaeota archaeon]|nr:MarC family protein [Nanoarchaeota archaeon]
MSFLTDVITMTVVVNPFSKMLVSSVMSKKIKSRKDVKQIINYSNLIGLLLLLLFALVGPLIFKNLLGISDTALIIASGVSLIIFGINYLFKDEVFKFDEKSKHVMYLSIGTPLIAGPASITTITLISSYSSIIYSASVAGLAILANYLLMFVAYNFMPINPQNEKINYLNVRLTGLFMLSVGIQFFLNGAGIWLNL